MALIPRPAFFILILSFAANPFDCGSDYLPFLPAPMVK